MLQILLMILKILGILLLVILGMILAVLLVVLFVPVRYRADVSFDGKPRGDILVSWFLHLVTVRVNYDDSVKALVKLLWFRLFDKTIWPSGETPEDVESLESLENNPDVTDVPVKPEPVGTVKTSDSSQKAETNTSGGLPPSEKPEAARTQAKQQEGQIDITIAEATKTVDTAIPEEADASASSGPEETMKAEKAIEKIRCAYRQICGKADAGKAKMDQVRTFLADTENRNTLRLLWNQVKKLLRHIFPRKFSGHVRFGFDDPATTGQILTYISPFYGLYAKTLEIEPIFDEKVMEGELHIKGHIRVAGLLWIVIRVFLNKNFRKLLKKLMTMGKK